MNLLKAIPSILFTLSISEQPVNGQIPHAASANIGRGWTSNAFEHFVFIENRKQFDGNNGDEKSNIRYYANSKGVDVYFSSNGLIYRHNEYVSLVNEWEIEKMEHDVKGDNQKAVKIKHHYLHVEWLGANPSPFIEANEAQSFYYTYPYEKDNGKTTIKAACYKKIVYKDLYPDIDVEYILPEKGGVKYSLILRPGADLSKVKMRYNGAKGLRTDKEGNVIIGTAFGDFVDHSPISFYQNGSGIGSAFELKGNTVSFTIAPSKPEPKSGTLNPEHRTIIIDPWTSNPTFPVNKAYDVNYDLAGNAYIYGSTTPNYKLAKFNSAGVLQWIFTTSPPIPQPGANIGVAYGDFAVDEYSGTSYLVGTFAYAVKVNTSGFQTASSSSWLFDTGLEFWRCEYNRCIKKIIIGCGSVGAIPSQALLLDTALTTFTPLNPLGATDNEHDVALLTLDPNNSFCYMAVAKKRNNPNVFNNTMFQLPIPGLTSPMWAVNNGYTFQEINSVAYTPAAAGGFANGFNGMSCGRSCLYTYDGNVLKKWNKNTGAFIAQVTTGGTMFATGGLSADKCDNVYAGVGTLIKVYNSSLTQIATYNIPNTCYDLKLGPNNKLYACGNGFVSEIPVTPLPEPTSVSTPASGCNACNGTATAIPCGPPSEYSYFWSPGGQTTQIATGLCPGTYTVSIITNCSTIDSVSVSVTGGTGGVVLSSTQTNACSNSGSATVVAKGGSVPYTYSWSNGQSNASVTGLPSGNYTITVTDANGCSAFRNINIANEFNMNYISQYSKCSPGNTGSIMVTVTGGSPPYLYNWSNGSTSAGVTGLSAGSYKVTVTDSKGCTATLTPIVTNPPLMVSSTSTNLSCGTDGSASVEVTAGVGPFTYSWSGGQTTSTISGIISGIYIVTVTDGTGCNTITKTFNITGLNPGSATFTQSPSGTVCAGTTVTFINTGGTGTYKWTVSPPNVSGTTLNFSYTFLTAGNYTIIHKVTNGNCADSRASVVTVTNCIGPKVVAVGNSVCQGNCGTVTASGGGGTSPYTYSWSNGGTTQNISPCPAATTIYTVTIRDTGGKSSTSTAVVTVNPAVNIVVTTTNTTCSGGTNGSSAASPGGGTSPYIYSWSNGQTTPTATGLSQGAYIVKVTDSKGCASTSTATIIAPPPLVGQFIKGTASCNHCGCKEWVMVKGLGGTSPYSFTWPDGYSNRYKNHLCPGLYIINIKDKNGCSINVNLSAP